MNGNDTLGWMFDAVVKVVLFSAASIAVIGFTFGHDAAIGVATALAYALGVGFGKIWPLLIVVAVLAAGVVVFDLLTGFGDASEIAADEAEPVEPALDVAALEADVFRPVSEWITEAEAAAVKEWQE